MSSPRHFGTISSPNHVGTPTEQDPSAIRGASSQSKPIRLALACNQCRKRKVRCDAQQPKCRNCSVRGDTCETSDPRKSSHLPAVRRRAAKRWQSKTRQQVAPTPSPAHLSPVALQLPAATLDAGSTINSVLNPTGPAPRTLLGQDSPDARDATRSSALPGSSASPALSSSCTNKSERLGENHFSWQSRAYQESTAAQIQDGRPGLHMIGQGATETPFTQDEAVNTDSTEERVKHVGASSVQCLFNFVDLHLARYGFSQAAPLFRHGMSHTEEFPMPLIPKLSLLPDRQCLTTYTDAFFARLWPIYPVVDQATFKADIATIFALQEAGAEAWQKKVTLAQVPALVSAYAIISLGMNETSDDSELSFECLIASHSLHGHLTALPYLTSVQALFLLSLALRAFAKDGQAWHILGHAIRVAQSIGLHKAATNASEQKFTLGAGSQSLQERAWWSCFALEKLMQLECGRPSIIDRSYDSVYFDYPTDKNADQNIPYFSAWIALSTIMGRISNRLYSHRFQGGSAEMLSEVAKLDQELLEWGNSLPHTLKPWNTSTNYSNDEHKLNSAFLSQQYYHAQLSLMRFAVIFPQKSLDREVSKNKDDLPSHSRLLNGASICASAARSIITQSLEMADSRLQSALLAAPPTYLAAVVLALGVLRQPNNRLVRSDVELLASATELVETWYLQRGFELTFTQTCTHLRERVVSIFQRSDGSIRKPVMDIPRGLGAETTAGQQERQEVLRAGEHLISQHGPQYFERSGPIDETSDPFGNFQFEDLWNMTDMNLMAYEENQFVTQ
ncbi:hypothetical protein N7507_008663 [Penicillium longicatenatum]|nr:hypothetical protein N7507_008663 [Penicillium longicatenatum]